MRIVVTGGAIIRDRRGRVLLQRRSDYGNWGLPGGSMDPGETIEEAMIREVKEETGLSVLEAELYAVYSGSRMEYVYPDGNRVSFVMFLFSAKTDHERHLAADGDSIPFRDQAGESLSLRFRELDEELLREINPVQLPVFQDLLAGRSGILRS